MTRKLLLNYFWNWFVIISTAISVLFGGSPEIPLSERVGLAWLAHRDSKTYKSYLIGILRAAINLLFIPFGQKDHVLESLFGQTKTKELWEWGKPNMTQYDDGQTEFDLSQIK